MSLCLCVFVVDFISLHHQRVLGKDEVKKNEKTLYLTSMRIAILEIETFETSNRDRMLLAAIKLNLY